MTRVKLWALGIHPPPERPKKKDPPTVQGWSDSEDEQSLRKEREAQEARAMTEKCRRENEQLRRELAEMRKIVPKKKKKQDDTPDITVLTTQDASDDNEMSTAEVDGFETALAFAQEAFDQQKERSGPINDAYARIVDGALR